jgi:hypothetical protein
MVDMFAQTYIPEDNIVLYQQPENLMRRGLFRRWGSPVTMS